MRAPDRCAAYRGGRRARPHAGRCRLGGRSWRGAAGCRRCADNFRRSALAGALRHQQVHPVLWLAHLCDNDRVCSTLLCRHRTGRCSSVERRHEHPRPGQGLEALDRGRHCPPGVQRSNERQRHRPRPALGTGRSFGRGSRHLPAGRSGPSGVAGGRNTGEDQRLGCTEDRRPPIRRTAWCDRPGARFPDGSVRVIWQQLLGGNEHLCGYAGWWHRYLSG
ncbi:unannotated protein [freshwater metagenome]|uniref:Unannotated protein n=1 Tax=freshwater metagenome TaxID=449393 RepID=A0A6J7NKR8_9ZZZZ